MDTSSAHKRQEASSASGKEQRDSISTGVYAWVWVCVCVGVCVCVCVNFWAFVCVSVPVDMLYVCGARWGVGRRLWVGQRGREGNNILALQICMCCGHYGENVPIMSHTVCFIPHIIFIIQHAVWPCTWLSHTLTHTLSSNWVQSFSFM